MTNETIWVGRARFPGENVVRWVRVRTDGGVPAAEDVAEAIDDPWAAVAGEEASAMPIEAAVGGLVARSAYASVRTLALLPPVAPSKIVAVGRNYVAHAAELGHEVPTTPLLFFKPPSALLPSGAPIVLPSGFERIDMEAELVVVIGRRASRVPAHAAAAHVGGYTLGNDVSCRDLQQQEKTWARAKGYDTFAPVGPWVRVGAELPPTGRIRGFVDDTLRQDAPVSDMVFPIPTLIESISGCMTLEPGDIIYSGTPAGVSKLEPGFVARVEFDGLPLGILENPVVAGG